MTDWREYHPSREGQAPDDYVAGSEVEFRGSQAESWASLDGECPLWFRDLVYRYRPQPQTAATSRPNQLPEDSELRNSYPMADGLLDYFPNALAEVSRVSYIGNQKHNPGEPMNWARGKSTDHANKIARHLIDRGGFEEVEVDGKKVKVRHSAYLAWRALANLQEELEREEGYPMSRASTPA